MSRIKTCQLRLGKAHSSTGMQVENMRLSGIKNSQSGELLGSFGICNKWSVLNSSVIRQSTERVGSMNTFPPSESGK
jgi:hypothetical protein